LIIVADSPARRVWQYCCPRGLGREWLRSYATTTSRLCGRDRTERLSIPWTSASRVR